MAVVDELRTSRENQGAAGFSRLKPTEKNVSIADIISNCENVMVDPRWSKERNNELARPNRY